MPDPGLIVEMTTAHGDEFLFSESIGAHPTRPDAEAVLSRWASTAQPQERASLTVMRTWRRLDDQPEPEGP